jgi:hypothetical protein
VSVMKTCCKCGESKDESEFYRHGKGNLLKRECKECTKKRTAKRNAERAGKRYHTLAEWRKKIGANRKPKPKRKEMSADELLIKKWSRRCKAVARKLGKVKTDLQIWMDRCQSAASCLRTRATPKKSKRRRKTRPLIGNTFIPQQWRNRMNNAQTALWRRSRKNRVQ